jgi:DNA repair protein RecN (Recombination protein N)
MLARMLRRLTVRNLAIVEDLEIDLSEGLTVITGETGAGKSILVDALALLAGGRGSSALVRTGAPKLSVAGEFDADDGVRRVLAQAGLPEGGGPVLLRRELAPDGRGRAFVEDEPASVRTLARLGERLLSIHGQYSEQELEDPAAHLELLDAFARADAERERVAAAAARWGGARETLEGLEASGRERAARLETIEFQISEIESVGPTEREELELPAERERLRHADRIRRAGEAALAALSEDEGSAADRLGEAARAFAELSAIDPREDAHRAEAEELKRRIADLAAAARDAAGAIDADPERVSSRRASSTCPA